ncbi:hypothetical protein BDV38DRAFT_187627 [Aspergillus pseudotamarii]|uniref:Secreted protein n=1 Tax=Aspergillus pseudotamarii TaxID=132259 RepID=A0A5N6SET1_ASPPS|nr:uncharacterized protein BDV38DRAFT_187627 [Aspergillus pseudotamarii]KAE8133226.1 hypothetical protein BDV38DRAFT_187627 [Aspergillus pseudotamarii]
MNHFLLLFPWIKIKLGSMVIRGLNSPATIILSCCSKRSPLVSFSPFAFHSIYAVRGIRSRLRFGVPALRASYQPLLMYFVLLDFARLAWSRTGDTDSTRAIENMIRILVGKKRVHPSSSLRSPHLTCSAGYLGIRGVWSLRILQRGACYSALSASSRPSPLLLTPRSATVISSLFKYYRSRGAYCSSFI